MTTMTEAEVRQMHRRLESAGCGWPACACTEQGDGCGVLISPDGEQQWCLCHLIDEDCLPALHVGVTSSCSACGRTCITWTAEVGGGGIPVHRECLRSWTMAQVAAPRAGAYARRRQA